MKMLLTRRVPYFNCNHTSEVVSLFVLNATVPLVAGAYGEPVGGATSSR
jgi:hypothetical protein